MRLWPCNRGKWHSPRHRHALLRVELGERGAGGLVAGDDGDVEGGDTVGPRELDGLALFGRVQAGRDVETRQCGPILSSRGARCEMAARTWTMDAGLATVSALAAAARAATEKRAFRVEIIVAVEEGCGVVLGLELRA